MINFTLGPTKTVFLGQQRRKSTFPYFHRIPGFYICIVNQKESKWKQATQWLLKMKLLFTKSILNIRVMKPAILLSSEMNKVRQALCQIDCKLDFRATNTFLLYSCGAQ